MTESLQDTNDQQGVDVEEFNEEELIQQLEAESKKSKENEELEEDFDDSETTDTEDSSETSYNGSEEDSEEEEKEVEDFSPESFLEKYYTEQVPEVEEPVETVESLLDSVEDRVGEVLLNHRQQTIDNEMKAQLSFYQEKLQELDEDERKEEIDKLYSFVCRRVDDYITQNYDYFRSNVENDIVQRLPENEQRNIKFIKDLVQKNKGSIDLKGSRVIAKLVSEVADKLKEKEKEINSKLEILEKKKKIGLDTYSERGKASKREASLSQEELSLCKAMGVNPKSYLKNKKK